MRVPLVISFGFHIAVFVFALYGSPSTSQSVVMEYRVIDVEIVSATETPEPTPVPKPAPPPQSSPMLAMPMPLPAATAMMPFMMWSIILPATLIVMLVRSWWLQPA